MITEWFNESISKDFQILTIDIETENPNNFFLSGIGGVDFCDWIEKFEIGHEFKNITNEMKEFWNYVYKSDETNSSFFRASILKNNRFLISCPGDACEVYTNTDHRHRGGKAYSCHNTDNPVQQLTLLVGVAILSEMAGEEIKGS